MRIIILLLINIILISNSYGWSLKDVFQGMSYNKTKAGSYHDQAAGHYSGGGLAVRTNNQSLTPLSITPPSLSMGCAGIDMYLGSLSMVKGDQLVNMFKSLGSVAVSYGIQLGLKTFAPQMENLLKDLRNLIMQANQWSVANCEAVMQGFAGMLPKDSAMRENVCKDLKASGGQDYFGQRASCVKDEDRKDAIESAQKKDKEMLIDNYNIFIKAAEKAKIPEDMRSDMMSMLGTIVMKDGQRTFYESLAKDHDSWVTYLKGGDGATIYSCTDNKQECLEVKIDKNQTITLEASYQGKAEARLKDLKKSFNDNKDFSADDINFLSSIGDAFPIYDYISLEVVTGVNILEKSAELSGSYMMLHHLQEVISEIRQGVANIQGKQIEDTHIKDYLVSLDRVEQYAREKWEEMMTVAARVEKRARMIESHHLARERS